MPSRGTSYRGSMQHSHEEHMVDRLAKIEYANPTCADCGKVQCPRWASFLRDKLDESESSENQIQIEGYLAVLVCDDCAILHHQELGDKRCMLKCLECVHEWSHNEADIVLGSGNALTNRFYEADLKLSKTFIAKENMQDKFIRMKYKKHRFRDNNLLQDFLKDAQKEGANKKLRKRLQEARRNTWTRGSTDQNVSDSALLVPTSASYRSFSRKQRLSKAIGRMTTFSASLKSPPSSPSKSERCPSISSPSLAETQSLSSSLASQRSSRR